MIVIVDYGMGNLGSIRNVFARMDVPVAISASPQTVASAEKIVLPGVGSFDAGIRNIEERALRPVLDQKALFEKVPVLGICLGAQLMTSSSEEGELPGLGWIPARTRRFVFPEGSSLKVPHMGWNQVAIRRRGPLTLTLQGEQRFYFVHSYYIEVMDEQNSMFKTTHGFTFDSGICRENIYGVQFHPEKSHKYGMKILENFARM